MIETTHINNFTYIGCNGYFLIKMMSNVSTEEFLADRDSVNMRWMQLVVVFDWYIAQLFKCSVQLQNSNTPWLYRNVNIII